MKTLNEHMKKGLHGKDEKPFRDLDYQGQSASLNQQIDNIGDSLKIHFEKGESEEKKGLKASKEKYKKQLLEIIELCE